MNNLPNSPRRQLMHLGPWNTTSLDYRDPCAVIFWSITYAGLGHILLDHNLRGFILLSGELIINSLSHLNMAIYYTLSQQFSLAKQVLEPRWLFLYLGVYCFSIFDSYREAIIINNTYRLADRENAEIKSFAINAASFSVLDSISPYIAALWSAIFPGTGCFLAQRMNRALLLMTLWVVVAGYSGAYSSAVYTLMGKFEMAKQALNIQWFLNIPSIWFFSVYEAYQCALESNKICRRELMQYFQREYQCNRFMIFRKEK